MSSTTKVYKYRFYCETEAADIIVWGESAPTVCPNDPGHVINTDSMSITQTVSSNDVNVHDSTPGYFQASSFCIDVPAGSTGDITPLSFSYPFDIQLWKTRLIPPPDTQYDSFDVIVAPDTTVSVLTATGNIGDTVLHLHPAVFGIVLLVKGVYIKLFNGVTSEDVGRIIAINSTNYTVTVETALTNTFAPGTYVIANLYLVKDYIIPYVGVLIEFGNKGFNTKKVPANTVIKFLYKNNNGLEKKVCFGLEYNYF